MVNFVRTLCITIASGLFSFVPKLYKLFYDLAANHNLFSSETLQTFSRNIYVLISVVMLFAFAVKAIESIINPDLLFDSKKGFTSVIKRSAIALVLIVLVPYGFTLFYQVQDEVMSKSLIEKIILGVNVDNSSGNLAESSGAAQMLGSMAIQAVLYPTEDGTCTEYEDTNVCSEYSSVINEDVGKLGGMVDNINEKVENSEGNEEYVLTYEWNGLLSVIVAGVLVYMLAIFCLDTALRLIKMAFLELTAPISIIAYIYAGNDTLKKWWKEVLGTAVGLFGRIAALAFMIFVLSKLPEFTANNFGGKVYTGIVNLLIIFATLMFIKEAPSMIDKLFGIKVGGKGGIAGRLGNMAGVGGIAKSAWQTLTKAVPIVGGVAAAGLGAAAALGGKALDNKAFGGKGQAFAANVKNKTASVRNSGFGKAVGTGVNAVKAGVNSKGGFVGSMKAATDSMKNSTIGKEYDYQLNKKRTSDLYEAVGLNDVGKLRQADDNHPVSKDTFKGAKEGIENYSKELAKTPLNSATKEALNKKISMDKVSKALSSIKDTNSNILSSLDTAAGNAKTAQARNIIENLKSEYAGGKLSLDGLHSRLQEMVDKGILSAGVAGGINKNINKMDHLLSNDDKDLQSAFGNIIGENGKISNGQISVQAGDAEKRAATAKAALEHEKSISSDYDKTIIERFEGVNDNLVSEYVRKSGAKKDGEADKYSITDRPVNTETSNQNTQTSNSSIFGAGSTSNSTNAGTPSGYAQTDSGIVVPNGTNTSGANTMNSTGESSTGYEIPADGGGYSGGTNNSNASAGSTIVNNTTNNNGASTEQDLSSFFSNLSNDIKNANKETNNILNDQLKSQQSMLDESKKQSRSLDNINSGVDSIKGSVDELGNKMDSYGTSINRNIDDLNKKMDDNE